MIIRSDQLQHFSALRASDFAARMCAHLREAFPAECASYNDTELRALNQEWIGRAQAFGLSGESDVEQFLELCVSHEELSRTPPARWTSEILSQTDQTPSENLGQLRDELIFGRRRP
jgi:hypothetical protein